MEDTFSDPQTQVNMYDGKVFGHKVSKYGLERGYLDYRTLSKIVGDCVLNNEILSYTGYENWDLVLGDWERDIYQYYIISYAGYQVLETLNTNENVYYNEDIDMFVWGISHFGTSWDYVLTDLELVEKWGDL